MSESPKYPTISPYLLYEDAAAALDWLTNAFGFRERLRFNDDSGQVTHAELEHGDGLIMLGQPGGDYQSPKRTGKVSHLVSVYVEDVDKHFQVAKEAGATIVSDLENKPYGDRSYIAEDLEGQQWTFAQHITDVAPEEWGAATS
jgi:PhnB protein